MRLKFFGRFDPRFSLILSVFLVLLGVTVWPTTKAVGKRTSTSKSNQEIQSRAQKGKRVTQRFPLAQQPVDIIEVKTNGKVAKLYEGIDAGDEWLNGLSLKIKNNWNKTIVSLYLTFILPETEINNNPPLAIPIHYGASPPGATQPGIGEPLEPNNVTDITITEQMYNQVKPNIESRIPIRNLKNLEVALDLIIFNDDTAWSAGELMRRDPNNPRKWIPIH